MSDLNRVTVLGRLTKDPELKDVNGTPLAKFSIAISRVYKDKKDVDFVNCTAWGKTAETIHKYIKKGQQILIDGRLRQNRWEDSSGNKRDKIEVIVENFSFIGSKSQDKPAEVKEDSSPSAWDDLPF